MMREGFGLVLSLCAHAAILLVGLLALPSAAPLDASSFEALPVELVSIAELTDLTRGDRKSETMPVEAPQPKPLRPAPEPTPVAAEEPAEELVEAVEEPEPQPEPEPEPDQLAALIEEPVAEPEPEPQPEPVVAEPEPAPEPDPVTPVSPPRARPAPPKVAPREVAQPAKPKPVTPPPKEEPEFRPDDIAMLLNKRDPAGGGDPLSAAEPQTFGAAAGDVDSAMTQSEVDALKAMLYRCWNPPIGVREAVSLTVTVGISLRQDGGLAGPPRVLSGGFDELSRLAAESAVRAVQVCAPFDILPQEKYQAWREIEFVFDPREMLGG